MAIIGIDRYVAWPQLGNAVSDARGAAQVFGQLGFVEVASPLLDGAATGEALRRLVTNDLAQLTPDDSLVVFFAGHGHTHIANFGDVTVQTGYLIPVDGDRPSGHMNSSWLRLDSWLSDIARLPSQHILVIIDACHSGVALADLHKWRDAATCPIHEYDALRARRSRRVITSALGDQKAMDSGPYPGHSLFTGCLIEGLRGGLAEGGRRFATGREIGQYVHSRVRSFPRSTQTPDAGAFELDDRGDLVVPILSEQGVFPRLKPGPVIECDEIVELTLREQRPPMPMSRDEAIRQRRQAWDERKLCPDGGCIGVIGPNDSCNACGRSAVNADDDDDLLEIEAPRRSARVRSDSRPWSPTRVYQVMSRPVTLKGFHAKAMGSAILVGILTWLVTYAIANPSGHNEAVVDANVLAVMMLSLSFFFFVGLFRALDDSR